MSQIGFKSEWKAYDKKYLLTHPWIILQDPRQEIKWAWQRVWRGWDNVAVWSIDLYLAQLIPELIKQLNELERGVPIAMFEDDDWDDENYRYKPGATERAALRWEGILNEIIEGFEEYAKLSLVEGGALRNKKFQRAFILFQEYFGNLWW